MAMFIPTSGGATVTADWVGGASCLSGELCKAALRDRPIDMAYRQVESEETAIFDDQITSLREVLTIFR